MSRYIDEKDVYRLVEPRGLERVHCSQIDELPRADVVEVRHGEWKKSSPYNRFMNCSVCGFGQDHTTFKYCPNCGAKMDGERREE